MKIEKLIVASRNSGKIREIREMLAPYRVAVLSAEEAGLPEVEETGATFEENARLKSETLAKLSGCFCLGDDSGLCVSCLGGRPGVYSARYVPNRDFDKGMDKLLDEMKQSGSSDRSAYFSCVLALTSPDGKTKVFEGRVDGIIAGEKSGCGGFGFDPLFIPDGFDKTFAHFTREEKNKISHRGRAFQKMIAAIFDEQA